jgi:hypothetical protein
MYLFRREQKSTLRPRMAVSSEWRLDKSMVSQVVFVVVAAAMGNFSKFVSVFIE